jgi:CheY-like chemotaxis protein
VTINTGPILVVEDILAIREMVEMQLTIRGYQVITARDGEEALARVAQDRPAVIIADILMPRIDGFLLVHKLQSDPQTATIPIIFLSATYVSAEDERFALDLGAIRFLSKPAEPDELLAAIADAITGQPVRRTPMSDHDFYIGYRERLDSKLKQKATQITRNQQILTTLPDAGKDTYRKLIADAQLQYDEIQRELTALLNVLNEINNEEKNDK